MALEKAKLQDFARRERGAFEDVLKRFVEVPSVSADPGRKRDLEGVAELGAETIRRFGGQAELFRVEGGSPVVLGNFEATGVRPLFMDQILARGINLPHETFAFGSSAPAAPMLEAGLDASLIGKVIES